MWWSWISNGYIGQKEIYRLAKNDKERIKVSITHTIDDSLKEYDTILYFNNGILAEQGSFDELCSKKEEFYKFYSKRWYDGINSISVCEAALMKNMQ